MVVVLFLFFFKQKTAYEMRISDWSSDVCSSDLLSSGVTLAISIFSRTAKREVFVERSKFKLVLQVFVPSAIFVVAIGFIGLYVAAVIYIAFFMWWLGRYGLPKILAEIGRAHV